MVRRYLTPGSTRAPSGHPTYSTCPNPLFPYLSATFGDHRNRLTNPARTIWGCDLQLAVLDAQVELRLTQEPHVQELGSRKRSLTYANQITTMYREVHVLIFNITC